MEYRRGARLGIGGMAEVFAGELLGTQAFARPVAIKRILPGYAQNPQFAAMFAAEAAITARLRHPNIVETLSFERDADGALVLVMELVQGVNLAALMTAGPVPPAIAAFIIAEILRGLGHAHAQRLVHRDVSPHNVLLSWEGAVKVSDFGIAKARDASEASASVMLKGKPAYMSPEQASAKPLDERSDLFAVGVILWELLAGRSLFKADDTRATLAAVLFGTVPQPRSIAKKAPKDLSAIAMRLLEKDREQRYASADAVLAELTAAYPAGEAARRALVSHLATAFSGEPVEPPRRQRWFAIAIGATVLIAAVSVVRYLLEGQSSTEPNKPSAVAIPKSPRRPLTPRDDRSTLVPYAKADGRSIAMVGGPLPSDAPEECRQLLSEISKIVRCGKLPTEDRDNFRYAPTDVGNAVKTITNRQDLRAACAHNLDVVRHLGVRYFIDCERSMGERLE